MKIKSVTSAGLFILLTTTLLQGYTDVTPLVVHNRLIAGDTLLILDVREWSDYTAGHMAEPAGQIPFTPACMPWNSNVLQMNFHQLPRTIDIIVHCASGGRSAAASKFLSDSGYTRIFNMTGGFNAWTYEKRTGGFGDHSGRWVRSTITEPDTVKHDSGAVVFFPASLTGMDSLYCEVHFAYGKQPAPGDAPSSSIEGLFRVTILDRFGLSLFKGDSLVLADSAAITLVPRSKDGRPLPSLLQTGVTVLAGPGQWKLQNFAYQFPLFHGDVKVLRQWYNAAGVYPESIQKHPVEPARSSYSAAGGGPATLYNLQGRLAGEKYSTGANPVPGTCGYYIIDTHRGQRSGTPSIGPRSITRSSHRWP
jgi:rhodanese-related sulfurtransferase